MKEEAPATPQKTTYGGSCPEVIALAAWLYAKYPAPLVTCMALAQQVLEILRALGSLKEIKSCEIELAKRREDASRIADAVCQLAFKSGAGEAADRLVLVNAKGDDLGGLARVSLHRIVSSAVLECQGMS